MQWLETPEAAMMAQAAKNKAWAFFDAKYPSADKSKFVA